MLDFKKHIGFGSYSDIKEPKFLNIVSKEPIDVATAENILIKSKQAILQERFKANQNLSIITDDSIDLH